MITEVKKKKGKRQGKKRGPDKTRTRRVESRVH